MKISSKTWSQYMMDLKTISNTAATKFAMYIMRHDPKTEEEIEAAIEYAYALATKYGEGASEMACQMYDAVAEASGKTIPPAVPAKTSPYGTVERAVRRAMEKTQNPKVIGDSVGCEVKRVSLETIKQNAARDGAEFAWVPNVDSCSFCLALAANGWQRISKKTLKAGHKDHIHANCDCTYAVRFDENTEVEGYDPEEYRAQWDAAEGNTSQEKIRFLDRKNYAANRKAIRARKNSEYVTRKMREIVANGNDNDIIKTQENEIVGLSSAARRKYLSNRDGFFQNMENVPELEGYQDIVCHADAQFFEYRDPETDYVYDTLTAKQFAQRLKDDGLLTGEPIRLFSCQSGKYPNGLAKQLAEELGVEVLAPENDVYNSKGGFVVVARNDAEADIKMGLLMKKGEKWTFDGWKLYSPERNK